MAKIIDLLIFLKYSPLIYAIYDNLRLTREIYLIGTHYKEEEVVFLVLLMHIL